MPTDAILLSLYRAAVYAFDDADEARFLRAALSMHRRAQRLGYYAR